MNLNQQKRQHKILDKVLITLITKSGLVNVYESVHSGTVITRKKTDAISRDAHPGIVIGRDVYGRIWVAHNHQGNNHPAYDTLEAYLKGMRPVKDHRQTDYSKADIVQRAMAEVAKGKAYHKLSYNCQTFVNRIVCDAPASEAVDTLSDGALLAGGLLGLIGLFAGSKTAIVAGAAIAGIGVTAKGI